MGCEHLQVRRPAPELWHMHTYMLYTRGWTRLQCDTELKCIKPKNSPAQHGRLLHAEEKVRLP